MKTLPPESKPHYKPLPELREAFGIGPAFKTPQTHLGWMLDLADKHGKDGLRYAVALKTQLMDSHSHHSDGTAIRVFVAEVMAWNNDTSSALLGLLYDEYAWLARCVSDLLPGLPTGAKPPKWLPLPFEVNYELACDFDGAGVAYALRYYTSPSHIGHVPLYLRSGYHCSMLLSRIAARPDLAKQLTRLLKKTEFKPLTALLKGSDSSGDGTGAVLDLTI